MEQHTFKISLLSLCVAGVIGMVPHAFAAEAEPSALPKPQPFPGQGKPMLLSQKDLMEFKALPSYSEPEWVNKLVKEGKLPPVKDRLPKEPMVFNSKGMPDGPGVYGGVFRMVSGGRPEGWNYNAGKNSGWGGTEYTVAECLTRTGPLTTIKKEEQTPLPNLAKSWEWSDDGKQLTMHLLEDAKWSDGKPFSSDDVMFLWNDNILDPHVTAWANKDTYGKGTTLEAVDKNTIRWTFKEPRPTQYLYSMAFFRMCPGPAHVLKQFHPKYNKDATYSSYANALPADKMPVVTMGAWVPVYHKADQMIVLRRNPYYWKVDEKGQQLPYMDELRFKLSTWTDREVQTVAGNADYANMENPTNYVESIKKAKQANSPARLDFSPRFLGWSLFMNQSEDVGATDDREKAIRLLNRQLKFRQAISHAIDRNALGQTLVRGPFSRPYAGGLYPEGVVNDSSVVYYGYNPKLAKDLLADVGLKDTDGNGIVNWIDGPMKGKDLEITMITPDGPGETSLSEGLVSMLREVGIKLIPRPMQGAQVDAALGASAYDFFIRRNDNEYIQPIQLAEALAPVHDQTPYWHKGTKEKPQNLLPFEKELVSLINQFQHEPELSKQLEILNKYNKVFTENVYHVGLVSVPGALILNKRLKNVPPGTPIMSFQWAEDSIMRERIWIDPKSAPVEELMPGKLPE